MKFISKDSGRGKNKQSDYKQKEAQKHIGSQKKSRSLCKAPVILAPTLATNIININERTDTIR